MMHRRPSLILAAVLLATSLIASQARAEMPVALELVLAVDTSESVDGFEFDLLRRGMAAAFESREVGQMIELQGGVAVVLFQWSSGVDRRFMLPWRVLRTRADCLAYARLVAAHPRAPIRGFTAIGRALEFALGELRDNSYEGRRAKIDLSGDGRSNLGLEPATAREVARALGVQINGLPILTSTYEDNEALDRYYREKVIEGPGAFVEAADDYSDFARAFKKKLLRELAPEVSGEVEKKGRG